MTEPARTTPTQDAAGRPHVAHPFPALVACLLRATAVQQEALYDFLCDCPTLRSGAEDEARDDVLAAMITLATQVPPDTQALVVTLLRAVVQEIEQAQGQGKEKHEA
jgi:hypothetical protein